MQRVMHSKKGGRFVTTVVAVGFFCQVAATYDNVRDVSVMFTFLLCRCLTDPCYPRPSLWSLWPVHRLLSRRFI
jgi:hypothetical protein